jgi:hypothetical protein
MPFVCHSTPHFDSTSREEPYSVALIIHHKEEKVNPQFAFSVKKDRKRVCERGSGEGKDKQLGPVGVQRYVKARVVQ